MTLGLLLLLFSPIDTPAQELDRFVAEMRMGPASPTGELSEFLEPGPTLWIGGRYLLNRRFAVLVEGGRSYLPARDLSAQSPSQRSETDARFQHLMIGTEVGVTSLDRDRLAAAIRLSAGRIMFEARQPPTYGHCLPLPRAAILEDSWTVGFGTRISYELRPAMRVSVGADVISSLQQEQDQLLELRGFPCLDQQRERKLVEGFDYPTTIPLTFGLSVAF